MRGSDRDGRTTTPIWRTRARRNGCIDRARACGRPWPGGRHHIGGDHSEPSSGRGRLVARSAGVLAGMQVVEHLIAEFELIDDWEPQLADGDRLEPGSPIARLNGPMRSLLILERIALNFLQRLSGIATLTAKFVAAVAGTRALIYDTRKTTPGWRPGKICRPVRWRLQSPVRAVRRGSDQGQSPGLATVRLAARRSGPDCRGDRGRPFPHTGQHHHRG